MENEEFLGLDMSYKRKVFYTAAKCATAIFASMVGWTDTCSLWMPTQVHKRES